MLIKLTRKHRRKLALVPRQLLVPMVLVVRELDSLQRHSLLEVCKAALDILDGALPSPELLEKLAFDLSPSISQAAKLAHNHEVKIAGHICSSDMHKMEACISRP